ncbi:kinase-like protein [Panus rudis PR-1116 ss-1]|nr:kinase-like protein [Panus rudis PR-1116 ss-1]
MIMRDLTSVTDLSIALRIEHAADLTGKSVTKDLVIPEPAHFSSSDIVDTLENIPVDTSLVLELTYELEEEEDNEDKSLDGAIVIGSPALSEGSTLVDPEEESLTFTDSFEESAKTAIEASPIPAKLTGSDLELVKRLGSGTFGTVSLAKIKGMGVYGAVKVIKKYTGKPRAPKAVDTFGREIVDLCGEEGEQSRFICEAAIQEYFAFRRMEGVEGIVQLMASFHDDKNFYFDMVSPFYAGGDLQSLLTRVRRLSIKHARFYIAQLLNAVEALHARGIMHRDIKPGNIFIDENGDLKLGDLGLARLFVKGTCEAEREAIEGLIPISEPEVTISGCGTPDYMAPEQYYGDLYSYPVDIFSVGVTAFRMLMGRTPWRHGNFEHMNLAQIITREDIKIDEAEREAYELDEDTEWFLRRVSFPLPSLASSRNSQSCTGNDEGTNRTT